MDFKIINSKYFRYIDQAFYSVSTLLLSVLAPLCLMESDAAEVLYLISFLLLCLSLTTAFFVTPIITINDDSNETISRIFIIFVGILVFLFSTTFVLNKIVDLKNLLFFYFVYLFCSLEFFRRVFIRKNLHKFSFFISMGMFFLIPLSYFFVFFYKTDIWLSLSLSLAFLFFCSVAFLASFISFKVNLNLEFIKKIFRIGLVSVGSFFVMWCSTQGVFVILYDHISHNVFIEQKLIFSILGFFNIIMLVQENKYQPLYSKAISSMDFSNIKKYDLSVNLESYIFLFLGILFFTFFWLLNFSFYLSFLLFTVFRFLMAISKSKVYYIRAIGRFEYLLYSNLIALILLLFIYIFGWFSAFKEYQIPMYFVTHAFVFWILTNLWKKRGSNEKYWVV